MGWHLLLGLLRNFRLLRWTRYEDLPDNVIHEERGILDWLAAPSQLVIIQGNPDILKTLSRFQRIWCYSYWSNQKLAVDASIINGQMDISLTMMTHIWAASSPATSSPVLAATLALGDTK